MIKRILTDNLSYKFVALGVALVLWFSLLGRRDSTLMKDYQLEVLLPVELELAKPVPEFIRVEVMGPRVALKKLGQSPGVYTIDLTGATVGRKKIRLSPEGVSLPLGARVVNISPKEFDTEIRVQGSSKGGGAK
jgi:YbbR domain-containing protein